MSARRGVRGAAGVSGRWIHLFEEDSARGAVYVPEATDVPLTRRPRMMLEFRSGGVATVHQPGPDDRHVATPARWSLDGSALTITLPDGNSLRGIMDAPARLTILT